MGGRIQRALGARGARGCATSGFSPPSHTPEFRPLPPLPPLNVCHRRPEKTNNPWGGRWGKLHYLNYLGSGAQYGMAFIVLHKKGVVVL